MPGGRRVGEPGLQEWLPSAVATGSVQTVVAACEELLVAVTVTVPVGEPVPVLVTVGVNVADPSVPRVVPPAGEKVTDVAVDPAVTTSDADEVLPPVKLPSPL